MNVVILCIGFFCIGFIVGLTWDTYIQGSDDEREERY